MQDYLLPAPILVGVELNPGPALKREQRKEILYMNSKGYSRPEIAERVGCRKQTVIDFLKRYKKTKSLANAPGQGRKRKLSRKDERTIVKKAKKGKTAKKLAQELSPKIKGGIEETTIRRTLRKEGLRYLVVEKREMITEQQAQKRISYAKEMKNQDWKYVLFTDEKSFQVGSTVHKKWQDPKNREIVEVKRHPAKVHAWAGIGYHFKTDLYIFEKNLDADLYCKILKSRLPPTHYYDLHPHARGKWIFVQDNDPKHKSRKATDLLNKLAPDRIQNHPPNSPDLNPIEDTWSILDGKLKQMTITNVHSLKKCLKKAWNDLNVDEMRNSIDSMPARLKECLEQKGKRTHY